VHHFPGYHIEEVVIIEFGPEFGNRGLILKTADDIVYGKIRTVREKHEVTGAQAQPAAMRKQIHNGEMGGYIGVIHPEFGDVIDDFITPVQFPAIHQDPQGGGRKRLAVGSNGEEGVLVYLGPGLFRGDPIAFKMGNLPVLNDPDGYPGLGKALHGNLHQGIDKTGADLFLGPSGERE